MVAGRLDTTMGGPSVRQFALRPGVHVTPVVDYTRYDWNSPGSSRRSVYRFLFRTLPDPFFDALDAADSSQLTAVRNELTTPLQALELLNNPFVLRQCEHFAHRLEAIAPDVPGRIKAAFEAGLWPPTNGRGDRHPLGVRPPPRLDERLPADRQQQRVPVRELTEPGDLDDGPVNYRDANSSGGWGAAWVVSRWPICSAGTD